MEHNEDILKCLIASLLMKPHTPVPYVLIDWKTQTVVPHQVQQQKKRKKMTTTKKNLKIKKGMTNNEKKKFQKKSMNMLYSGTCA